MYTYSGAKIATEVHMHTENEIDTETQIFMWKTQMGITTGDTKLWTEQYSVGGMYNEKLEGNDLEISFVYKWLWS